jgi:hypothetical protein
MKMLLGVDSVIHITQKWGKEIAMCNFRKKKFQRKGKRGKNLINWFIDEYIEPIDKDLFGEMYEYPLSQFAELVDDSDIILNDYNPKFNLIAKHLYVSETCYFDIEDKDYICSHNWGYNNPYARAGATLQGRPLIHQYIVGWEALKDKEFICHHLNSDTHNCSCYNLMLITYEKHYEYNTKISKIEKYVKRLLLDFIEDKPYLRKKDIKQRLQWFKIDILNQEIMDSLIREIKDNNLLDRVKLRIDAIYRHEYNKKLEKLYSEKLDSLIYRIENNEFVYEITDYNFNVDALTYGSGSSCTYLARLEVQENE